MSAFFNWWGDPAPLPPPQPPQPPLWSLKRRYTDDDDDDTPDGGPATVVVECVGGGPADGEFHEVPADDVVLFRSDSNGMGVYRIHHAAGVARFLRYVSTEGSRHDA